MSDLHRARPSVGRYRRVSLAPIPGDLPCEGALGTGREIRHAAVEDPNPSLAGRRQRVAVNVRTDALEQEYVHHRISESAYRAGRRYQAVLARARRGPQASCWRGERVDRSPDPGSALARGLDDAAAAVRLLAETRPLVGRLGERVLVLALAEQLTLTEITERLAGADPATGRASKHAAAMYAWTFRQALEILGSEWDG